jgi:hypothetical protein
MISHHGGPKDERAFKGRCTARTLTSFTIMRIIKASYEVYLVRVDGFPDVAHGLYVSAWTKTIDCARVVAADFIACLTLLSFFIVFALPTLECTLSAGPRS